MKGPTLRTAALNHYDPKESELYEKKRGKQSQKKESREEEDHLCRESVTRAGLQRKEETGNTLQIWRVGHLQRNGDETQLDKNRRQMFGSEVKYLKGTLVR